MASPDRELLSRTARNAVRALMSTLALGAIGEYWENEHFTRILDVSPGEGGVRKQLFDSYAASVDWTDEDHVARALRVFESLLRRLDREGRKNGGDGLPAHTVAELREAFARDGCRLDDELRLHTARVARLTIHVDARRHRVSTPSWRGSAGSGPNTPTTPSVPPSSSSRPPPSSYSSNGSFR
ncbi:hypothetical protein [Streptomyces sp. NBC_00342]|uniref:hypothetical protein n=1 Tax=Streptomyces sp. NBC_00342 TaxID=2975718 RepID=UPI002E2B49D2|nr:hypothetical protein [Streptomyces sp. NBC_00342]